MQKYVAPFETSLLFQADVAQKVEMISLYREFTGVTGVLLKYIWRSLSVVERTDLDERSAAKEEPKHVGHDVVTDHTGNWNDEPIGKSHWHLKPIIINMFKHSFEMSAGHASSCLLAHQIIPSNRLWMMRWDWVTTISRVTWVHPNCGERKSTAHHSFKGVKHFNQHVWANVETIGWAFQWAHFLMGQASLITQNPSGHLPCRTGGGSVSSPDSGQTCRNLKRRDKIWDKNYTFRTWIYWASRLNLARPTLNQQQAQQLFILSCEHNWGEENKLMPIKAKLHFWNFNCYFQNLVGTSGKTIRCFRPLNILFGTSLQLSQLWATDSSRRAGSGISPVSIMGQLRTVWAKNNRTSDGHSNEVTDFRWTNGLSFWLFTASLAPSFPAALRRCRCSCGVCTYDIEGKGNEAVVSAQDTERLLPLHQRKEVVCHRLTIEEVVDTKKKVPVRIKESS